MQDSTLGELVFNGFLLGKVKKLWREILVMVAQHYECTYVAELYI